MGPCKPCANLVRGVGFGPPSYGAVSRKLPIFSMKDLGLICIETHKKCLFLEKKAEIAGPSARDLSFSDKNVSCSSTIFLNPSVKTVIL